MGATTYICGHRNPDTDSIVSAMALASLHSTLGEDGYVPVRLGLMNDETAFLMKKFDFQPPQMLSTVRTQVSDIEFDRPPRLGANVPMSHAWELIQENPNLSSLPVVNEDGTLYGILTAGNIAESDMQSILTPKIEDVPVFNILSALEGRILNENDHIFDQLSGEVMIALPSANGCLRDVNRNSIVLCGQQEDIVEEALRLGAGCVILCESNLAEKYLGCSENTCMISTPYDVWRAARMLYQAVPVGRIARRKDLTSFHLSDFLDDVQDIILQSRYRSYPVLDEDDRVVGTLSRYHLLRPQRKRIILVDHNETGQAVPGLEQAELVGIIDHHRLGDVETGYPVFVRNEPVGSTTTIIGTMFQEHGLMPGAKLAGLMAGAILSDTIMFKSPTTTVRDRKMAERLAHAAGISLEDLGKEVFSAGTSDKPASVLLKTDFKEFHLAGHKIGISQITTMDSKALKNRKDEFLMELKKMKAEKEYDMALLMITDVLRVGTDLIFVGDKEIIRQAFSLSKIGENTVFLKGVVSRKKQMVPALSALLG
ncbi:MAG: putative manganese-dependent inorganic diphosphatase [Clostridiales bacterium]|nr:putative manganese-dependent inorganic diphosphatase [Clostridiales bacterium]